MPSSPPPRHGTLSARLAITLAITALLGGCSGDPPEVVIEKARTSALAGDHKTAVIELKNLLEDDPNNAAARFELGKVLLDQRDMASAEKEFRRAREAGFSETQANIMIARALLGLREFQKLLDEIPAPTDNSDDAATLLALRANASLGLDRKDDARRMSDRAIALSPNNADAILAQAHLAIADSNIENAQRAVQRAISADPKHVDSWLLRAGLARLMGNNDEARAAYDSLLKFDPNNLDALLSLADLDVAENKLAEARQHVNRALQARPNDLRARYASAAIDFRERNATSARDTLAQVLRAAPNYLPALMLGAQVEFALGNMQTAESHLNKVLAAAPGHPQATRLLAATQLRLNRPGDAERTLAPLLNRTPIHPAVLIIAGEIALAKREFGKASGYFDAAARLAPDNALVRTELGLARLAQGDTRGMADLQAASGMDEEGSRADSIIILTHLQQRRFDAAMASIDAMEKKLGVTPLSLNYRGAAFMGQNNLPQARASFNRALEMDPRFLPAAANLAQLDLRDKRPDAARQRFESILKLEPANLAAMLALAEIARLQKDDAGYRSWLDRAAKANPQALQPRMALAQLALSNGDKARALALAREAVNLQPNNPTALELLGKVQLATNDTTNAIGTYRRLAELTSNAPMIMAQLGAIQASVMQYDDARRSFQTALATQPDFKDAQLLLARMEIQARRFDEALRIARTLQQQRPKEGAGFLLEGDVFQARKQFAEALAAYERAHQVAPGTDSLIRQTHALAGLGRPEESERRLAAWLSRTPNDNVTRLAYAELLLKRGNYTTAAEQYMILNNAQPENTVILNNLAWALSQANDPRAVGFAEQALRLSPEDISVLDTHGWVLTRAGQAAKGLPSLQKAFSRAPDNAEIHWHLVNALHQTGDTRRARQELTALLDRRQPFSAEQEARELLRQLNASR